MTTGRGRRRRVATIAVPAIVALLATSCAQSTGGAGGASGATLGDQPAVSVAGVQSCRKLLGVTLPPGARPGKDAARLESRNLDCLTEGPGMDVSSLGVRPVVINIWASWCGPCRREMPLLQEVSVAYADTVQFVGIDANDEAESAAAFLKTVGVTYPQLSDPAAGVLGDLRIPGLPVTVVLNADGSIYRTKIGAFNSRGELTDLLDKLLVG